MLEDRLPVKPKVSVQFTGRELGRFCARLDSLRGYAAHHYLPRVWNRTADSYSPPGLWYKMPPSQAAPLVHSLPPPHHPLEVIAADNGFGGPATGSIDDLCDRVRLIRGDRMWIDWVRRVAPYLKLTVPQAALMYHLFTPLATNGGAEHLNVEIRRVRRLLYRCAGIDDTQADEAERDATPRPGDASPVRIEFWGTEVVGEVVL